MIGNFIDYEIQVMLFIVSSSETSYCVLKDICSAMW